MLVKLQSDVEIRGGVVCQFCFRWFKLTVGRVIKLFECNLSHKVVLRVGKSYMTVYVIPYSDGNIS